MFATRDFSFWVTVVPSRRQFCYSSKLCYVSFLASTCLAHHVRHQ